MSALDGNIPPTELTMQKAYTQIEGVNAHLNRACKLQKACLLVAVGAITLVLISFMTVKALHLNPYTFTAEVINGSNIGLLVVLVAVLAINRLVIRQLKQHKNSLVDGVLSGNQLHPKQKF